MCCNSGGSGGSGTGGGGMTADQYLDPTYWRGNLKKKAKYATMAQAVMANRSQQFSMDYFNETVKPMVQTMGEQTKQTMEQQKALFDLQFPQAQAQGEMYMQYGLPAQQEYYKAVQEYSAPEYQEQEARAAMGDVRSSAANVDMQTNRMLAARGIDPTSGAAMYNKNIASMNTTAAGAAASNQARVAAQRLGLQLKASAADFAAGRGVTAQAALTGGASNASMGGLNAAGAGIGYANQGGALPMQGFGQAGQLYGSAGGTFSSMWQAQEAAKAQSASGFGQLVGSLGSAAIMASDRRLKKDIVRVGTLDNGLPVYEYEYVWGGGKQVGVMADEVELVIPAAVITGRDGFKRVRYDMVVR
jgi:hypothetical protein